MDQKEHNPPLRSTITLLVALSILFTYFTARVLYLLMKAHYIPSLSLRLSETLHIHHYFYGILLLSFVCYAAFLARKKFFVYFFAILYGIALGLTYDEALMWVYLDGRHSEIISLCTIGGIAIIFLFLHFFFIKKDKKNI